MRKLLVYLLAPFAFVGLIFVVVGVCLFLPMQLATGKNFFYPERTRDYEAARRRIHRHIHGL